MISYSRPNSLYPTLNCLKTKAFSVARTHVVILDNNCISRSDSARSEIEKPRGRTGVRRLFGASDRVPKITKLRTVSGTRFQTSLESCALVAWTRSTKNHFRTTLNFDVLLLVEIDHVTRWYLSAHSARFGNFR